MKHLISKLSPPSKVNRIRLTLVLTSAFSYFQVSAQTDFSLSDYKLPDLKRHILETNFNLNGRNDYQNFPAADGFPYNEYSWKEYNGYMHVTYFSYLNTKRIQREINNNLYFYFDHNKTKRNNDNGSSLSSFTPSFKYSVINRRYNGSRKFLETDFLVSYSYEKTKSSYKTEQHNLVASLPLKIGTGRIEQVQDARQAVYILDELSKQQRLTVNPTRDDILTFAAFISRLKNMRFFDTRIQRMHEIEALDSFLIANNLASRTDSRYFTTLNDFWLYGDQQIRNSGTRLSAGLYPGYYYQFKDEYDLTTDRYHQNFFSLYAGLEFVYEKPINLLWQNTIEINTMVGLVHGKMNDKSVPFTATRNFQNARIGYLHKIGFFPNTRTDITFAYGLNLARLLGSKGMGFKAMTNLNVNYYISPKLRLGFYSSVNYGWQNSSDAAVANSGSVLLDPYYLNMYGYLEKDLNLNANLTFAYSIF